MQLELLRTEGNLLEIAMLGEDHTFANLLRRTLGEDDHVVYAAYKVGHPLLDKARPTLLVETDGTETPKEALKKAAEKIKARINEFGEKF